MTGVPPSEVIVSFADGEWLQFLLSQQRPNLLMICRSGGIEVVVQRLMNLCVRPLHTCHLPGELTLPGEKEGTFLLWDVAQLRLDQQVRLHDWMTERQQGQVVSV